jgi:RNA polymerase sigma-70 factor, ECF subfamily
VTGTRFAAAVFDEPPVMLMIRAAQTVTPTERFERDVLPHLTRVYRGALCLTGDPEAAEDLVAEAFARAYRAFPRRRTGLRLEAWLFRILVSAHRERRGAGRPAACGAIGGQPPVRRALRELPEDLRFAVYLAAVNGFSYREIAQVTGTSTETVAARIRAARGALRCRLSVDQERP